MAAGRRGGSKYLCPARPDRPSCTPADPCEPLSRRDGTPCPVFAARFLDLRSCSPCRAPFEPGGHQRLLNGSSAHRSKPKAEYLANTGRIAPIDCPIAPMSQGALSDDVDPDLLGAA